jgi:hypothetical protein
VNYRCLRLLFALAALVLLGVPGRSQGPILTSLRGEVQSDQVLLQGYFVELCEVSNRHAVSHEFVHPNGSFAFRNVPYGDYEVRVTNSGGEVVQQQLIAVSGTTPPVELRLRHQSIQRPPSGPVSLIQSRIMHTTSVPSVGLARLMSLVVR